MGEQIKEPLYMSAQAIKRMPYYIQYLKKLHSDGVEVVSAHIVAAHFNFKEIQVRKDFSAVSSTKGKPKSGFSVHELINSMEEFLGYHNTDEAVLVGAGLLGKALLSYSGFDSYGMKIIAAFDADEEVIGSNINGMCVLSADKISDLCRRMNIQIGIITVPMNSAQIVCDQLVAGGIRAVWNFAPVHLSVPSDVLVQNENVAASLAILSRHLHEQFIKE
jgi:redox-sensing transcriptional repressor